MGKFCASKNKEALIFNTARELSIFMLGRQVRSWTLYVRFPPYSTSPSNIEKLADCVYDILNGENLMTKADIMIQAWTTCKMFNELKPIGSIVKYKDKDYIVKTEAYVLVNEPHVQLEKLEHSVPLNELQET